VAIAFADEDSQQNCLLGQTARRRPGSGEYAFPFNPDEYLIRSLRAMEYGDGARG
jgi:hypothetical protein